MGLADFADTTCVSEVADANNGFTLSVSSLKDGVKQLLLLVLKVPSEGVGTNISDLDHACQCRVYEKRCLNDVIDLSPQSTGTVEISHKLRMFLCYRLVVIMNQKSVALCLLTCIELT